MMIDKSNFNINLLKKLSPQKEWIFLDGHEILRKKSTPVTSLSEIEIGAMNKMISYIDACYEGKDYQFNIRPGIAIAAPQVGLNKRMIYLHFDDEQNVEQKYFLINPEIIAFSEVNSYIKSGEGCLSVKNDVKGIVPRKYKVIVKGFSLFDNKEIQIEAKDLLAICLQHEIDHLDGILYHDHINKNKPNYTEKHWIKI